MILRSLLLLLLSLPLAATEPAAPLALELATDDECAAASCAVQALQRRSWSLARSVEWEDHDASSRREEDKADALQDQLEARLGDRGEVRALAADYRAVCVRSSHLGPELREAVHAVGSGLPPWKAKEVPAMVPDVAIAFLIQVTWKRQLPLVRRVFDRLYSPKDVFLYLVDRAWIPADVVADALPKPVPDNVMVQTAKHAPYFMWPRVEIVLQGLLTLLQHEQLWDFALHLSESDYPLHGLGWIRRSLASQRGTNFINIIPRCRRSQPKSKAPVERDLWYWWSQSDSVASCPEFGLPPSTHKGAAFPTEFLEEMGLKLARGVEWVALTRELVKYALSPGLLPFRKLVGMHQGSDEVFWQSMVLNIPNFTQRVSQHGWYIQWGHGKTRHSPDTLTEKHRDDILRNREQLLFMRKVTMADSAKLLDEIDALEDPPDLARSEVSAEDSMREAVACPKGTSLQLPDQSTRVKRLT